MTGSNPKHRFVKGDPVSLENFTNLFLVTEFLVMLGLVEDKVVTASTFDSLTEKAPYPSCQRKPWSPFSLRRLDEAPFSRPIRSDKATFFDSKEKT